MSSLTNTPAEFSVVRCAKSRLSVAGISGDKVVRFDTGGRGEVWAEEAFDYIVKRYKEYDGRACDNEYKVATENHWGPESVWANMKKLYEAVDHPDFGVSCHIGR